MPSWFAKLLELLSGHHLSQVGKNRLRGRIYARSDPRAHPPVFEEVEAYKNNFEIILFSSGPIYKFLKGGRVET
jgi:hypothetical protein